jgi:hypothetical protein
MYNVETSAVLAPHRTRDVGGRRDPANGCRYLIGLRIGGYSASFWCLPPPENGEGKNKPQKRC